MTDIETARQHLAKSYPEAEQAIREGLHDQTRSIQTILSVIGAERQRCAGIVGRYVIHEGSVHPDCAAIVAQIQKEPS